MKYTSSFPSAQNFVTRTSRSKSLSLLLASGLFLGNYARATQIEWTGGSNTTWATGTNWTGGTAPGATNDALFNQSTYTNAPTVAAANSALGLVFGSGNTNGITFGSGNSILTLGSDGISMANGSGAVSTGGAELAIGATQNWSNNSTSLLTIGGKIINGATTTPLTLTINGTGSGGTTLSGIIADGAGTSTTALVINASGLTTLSGVNTFTGGVTLTSGTLDINNSKALGAATGTFAINGGTIDNTSGAAITEAANPITVGSDFAFTGTNDLNFGTSAVNLGGANRTITANAGTLTFGGVISNGGLIKSGAGSLVLSGANTFTGGVTLNAGRLVLTNAGTSTSGSLGNGGTFTINGGTIDDTTTASSVVLASTTPVVIAGDFAYGTSAGVVTNRLTITGASSLAADHTITLNGAGQLTFAGVLTNTGDSARTLTVNDGAGTTSASTVTFGGYTLTGSSSTAARTDIINGSGEIIINGVISDGTSAGSGLTYGGTGTLDIAASGINNTYSGNTTVNSGSLLFLGNSSGAGNSILGTGSTVFVNGGDLSSNTAAGNGAVITQVLSVGNNDTVTFGKSGTAKITFGAGTDSIGSGASVTVFDSLAFLSNTTALSIGGGSSITIGSTGSSVSDAALQTTLGGNVTLNNNANASGANLVINSTVDGSGSTNAIAIGGAGNAFVELEGANSEYSGGVTVNNGGWLAVGGSTTVVAGSVTKGPLGTGTLILNSGKISGDAISGAHAYTVANLVNINAGSTVTFGDVTDNGAGTFKGTVTIGKNSTLTSPVVGYAATVSATSGNTITVASTTNLAVGQYAVGANIPAGTTITAINTSTKVVTLSANTTGSVTSVSFNTSIPNSTTFAVATPTTGAGGGGVVLGGTGSVVTVSPEGFSTGTSTIGSTFAFNSVISDGGNGNGINVGDGTSMGTVVFGAANTYTGATTIQSGVAQYNNATAFGANSAITVNSGGTAQVIGGTAGGGKTLTINGAGAAFTSGALDFSAGIGSYSSLVALGSNATVSVDALGTNSSLTGGIDTAGHTLTLNVVGATTNFGISGTGISNSTGTGNVIVTGGGDVALSAASTYNGTTTIQGDSTVTSGVTNALPAGTVLTMGNSTDSTGTNTFDLAGFNQTVGGLAVGAGTLASSQVITNNATGSGTSTLTVNNSGGDTAYSGVIQDGSTAHTALIKSGTSALTLSGINTYTGSTSVNAGTLILTGSTAAGSAVTVTSTLAGTGTVNGPLTTLSGSHLAPGATASAGSVGTLHVGSLGFSIGSGSNLDFDLATTSSATSDLLSMSGGTLTLGTALTFNINELGGSLATGTNYDLISGFSNGGLSLAGITFTTTGDAGLTATYSIVNVSGTNELVASFAPTGGGSTSYFYTGGTSSDFTDFHNYNTTSSGGTQQTTALSSTSDVSLSASPAPSGNVNPTLGTNNLTINTLSFTPTGANVSLNGTGTLTLAAAGSVGITDNSATTNSTETVAPTVALGASQTWTVANSASTLALTGGIKGTSGQTLTLTGPGSYNFSSGATGSMFAGNTTVNGGAKLLLTNGTTGSALGTGNLVVAGGSTIGGAGSATGMSTFTIGNASQALAKIQVGNGTDATSALTLTAATGTITNTTLAFNLSTTATATTNKLNVGATSLTFGSGDTLALNLQGTTVLAPNSPFILIAGTNGNGDGSLSGSQFSGLTSGGIDANGHVIVDGLTLTFSGSQPPSWYANSYVFLVNSGGVDDIEVEVVPEPSTWAMMLGGLGALLFWQRRKTRRD